MSRRSLIILGFTVCLLLPVGSLSRAQDAKGGPVSVSAQDGKFVLDAAISGYHEVRMGMLGVERGTNSDLKAYAQRIVDDHALSNAEIEALARLKGINLPSPTKTDAAMARLSSLNGIEFDQEFAREAIENHTQNLAEFEKEDQSATDPDLKGFVDAAIPKIRAHLEQAKALKP